MKSLKTYLLIFASISFIIIVGAAVYDHMVAVPIWKQAVPASLTMFQGEYGIQPDRFWMFIHPVTLLLLVSALIANWKTDRRKLLLIHLAGYTLAIISSLTFYVPELHSIINSAYSTVVNEDLTARAKTWEIQSQVRLGYMIILAAIILFSLTKPDRKTS